MQDNAIQTITDKNTNKLSPYFKQHGDSCVSYSSFQDELEHFYIPDIGYLSYLNYKHLLFAPYGIIIVLANPVCSKENSRYLLEKFITKYPCAMFIQISRETAVILDDLGYPINQFGIETEINIQSYDLKGKTKSSLRQWRNKCLREKIEITEVNLSQCDEIENIKALSAEWLKNKGGKELFFLNRPFLYENETSSRCFVAKQNNKLIGIAVFDPIYRDNKILGYYHNIDRIIDTAPNGVSPFLILEAINIFRQEKAQVLSLGMSPLYQLGAEFNYNKISRKVLRFSYKNMNFLYPFKGNVSHKKKFDGEQKRVYFCSTKGNNLWAIFLLMKAIRIF